MVHSLRVLLKRALEQVVVPLAMRSVGSPIARQAGFSEALLGGHSRSDLITVSTSSLWEMPGVLMRPAGLSVSFQPEAPPAAKLVGP